MVSHRRVAEDEYGTVFFYCRSWIPSPLPSSVRSKTICSARNDCLSRICDKPERGCLKHQIALVFNQHQHQDPDSVFYLGVIRNRFHRAKSMRVLIRVRATLKMNFYVSAFSVSNFYLFYSSIYEEK
jgi:hypothetical protein